MTRDVEEFKGFTAYEKDVMKQRLLIERNNRTVRTSVDRLKPAHISQFFILDSSIGPEKVFEEKNTLLL